MNHPFDSVEETKTFADELREARREAEKEKKREHERKIEACWEAVKKECMRASIGHGGEPTKGETSIWINTDIVEEILGRARENGLQTKAKAKGESTSKTLISFYWGGL